jgi:FixJ family two-component response regulator
MVIGKVTFLDDSEDLREMVHAVLLTKLQIDCICVGSLAELIERFPAVAECQLAILDINLGPNQPDGLEAYHWLRGHDFKGQILFLTGHARSNPSVIATSKLGAPIVQKPIGAGQLVELVKEAFEMNTDKFDVYQVRQALGVVHEKAN